MQQSVFRLTASCTCRASGEPGRSYSQSIHSRSYADADFLTPEGNPHSSPSPANTAALYSDGKQREEGE